MKNIPNPHNLTENDKKALRLLRKHGGCLEGAAAVGSLLYPIPRENGPKYRKKQGMALAAAKVMRRLEKRGLVVARSNNFCRNVYLLTQEGRDIVIE